MSAGKIRAVVLSAGAWSHSTHIPALLRHANVEIVAISCLNKSKADDFAREFHIPVGVTDWRIALQQKPDIVIVSSPPIAHEQQVIGALESGAHVLVEKPFALNARSALRMHEASLRTKRSLLVGFGWPSSPIFKLTKQLITNEKVGKIEHLTMHLAVNIRQLLTGKTAQAISGGAKLSAPETYTTSEVSGGGAVAVSMSHQLGLLEWLIGSQINSVSASIFPKGAETELHASVIADFTDGGSAALSCVSAHISTDRPQWTMSLYGDKGEIVLDSLADQLKYVSSIGTTETFNLPLASGIYESESPTNSLIDCAMGSSVPSSMNSSLAAHVVAVTDAIYESASTRRPTSVLTQR